MSDQATSVDFPQPSIGRIVHYFTQSEGPMAAIVLGDVDPSGRYGTCTLKVFSTSPANGDEIVKNVIYADKRADDSSNWWAWPPRV